MPTLIFPAASWALAALALPLALHLWRQPLRTVYLGSLRFLPARLGRRVHDLRWRERWLLSVRLGMLAALVFLLTRPIWRTAAARKPQRWILLDPAAAPAGKSLERLRALRADGYTMRPMESPAPVDLWSLLREADAALPPRSKLAVFTPGRLASLRGIRPRLKSTLEWVETTDVLGTAPRAWIESWRPATALPRLGVSDARGVSFTSSAPEGWKLETRAGEARLVDPEGQSLPWTTAENDRPLNVSVFHDPDRAEDARLLAAAVRTGVEADGTSLTLQLAVIQPGPVATGRPDWTFWLSATAPPASFAADQTRLFQDAPRAGDPFFGWALPPPGSPGAPAPVRLWQRAPPPTGSVVWTDSQRTPLLTRTPTGHGSHWRFASRFHPAWTDLPLTAAFPAWLRSLLLPEASFEARHDLRRVGIDQARPSVETATPATPSLHDSEWRDLHWPCWTLATGLFVAERFLSHRRGRMIVAPLVTPPLAAAR